MQASADDRSAIAIGLGELSRLSALVTKDNECWVGQDDSGKTCFEVSEEFCTELYDLRKGRSKVFDGEILQGRSPVSKLSWAQLEDYKALVESEPRLPADLREKAAPIIARFKKLLAEETDKVEWKRSIADLHRDFQYAVEDVYLARRDQKYPALKGLRLSQMDAQNLFAARRMEANLQGEILEAKYREHPGWKRVERLFPSAKEDILKTIDTLPVPAERKAWMRDRVSTIRLSLPYIDAESLNAHDSCATNDDNAFYSPTFHKFTVCAGKFTVYQSDSALYRTLLHEISHSIDPNAQDQHRCASESTVALGLNALTGIKEPISCDLWLPLEKSLLEHQPAEPFKSPLDKLYSCFERRTATRSWNKERVSEISENDAKTTISSLAKSRVFTDLASPNYISRGNANANELFLRPDLSFFVDKGRPSDSGRTGADPREIFTQVLACQSVQRAGGRVSYRDATLTPEERQATFAKAMSVTQALLAVKYQDEYSYCGSRCRDLKISGMGRELGEHFADWMATRSLWRFLARTPAGNDRRMASAVLGVTFCEGAGMTRSYPGLAHEEVKASLREHPSNARRRNSIFDEVSAELVGCKLDKEALESFGACEP